MKKSLFAVFIICSLVFLSSGCESETDSSGFIKVYGEVLNARLENPNSINAQYAVDSVLESNGYTLQTFGEDLEKFSTQNPDFSNIIDSLRNALSDKAKELDSLDAIREEESVNELDSITEQ